MSPRRFATLTRPSPTHARSLKYAMLRMKSPMDHAAALRRFPDESLHAMWLDRIDASATAGELARLIVDYAESYAESMHATVLWELAPSPSESFAAQAWLREVVASGLPQYKASGSTIAFRLCSDPQPVLLLLKLQPGCRSDATITELSPMLRTAGKRLGMLMQRADRTRLQHQPERAERLHRALLRISSLYGDDRNAPDLLREIHEVVRCSMRVENFFVVTRADSAEALNYAHYASGSDSTILFEDHGVPLSAIRHSLAWHVISAGESLAGTQLDLRRNVSEPLNIAGPDHAPWMGVPLMRNGQVRGALLVQGYEHDPAYSKEDRAILEFAGHCILAAAESRRMQEQLDHYLLHDVLTGLPNRRCMREKIERAQASINSEPHKRYALLHLDVDRFKGISDSLGQLAGDELLREIADRLNTCALPADSIARLSGDEFAVLLESEAAPTVIQTAQRVMSVFDQPFLVAGRELQISASMGIAIGDAPGKTVDQLLHEADVALYRAKRLGRKRFELFDATMVRGAIDVLSMELELRDALQLGQFEPYFQPICHLASGAVLGYEALIRWNHPVRGVLRPAEFLKVARDCKLIETIDWQMFELTFRCFAEQGPKDTFLTFNVSALHLSYEDFDARLIALLKRAGLRPAQVIMEITEDALLEHPDAVRDMLTRLRVLGIGAALDDFGTGYSSLHYLHALPLRILKIDRAFVEELDKDSKVNSTTVVAAILALAQALNIEVIAEGIETEAQCAALAGMGCQMGQGYLLGRPVSIANGLGANMSSGSAGV